MQTLRNTVAILGVLFVSIACGGGATETGPIDEESRRPGQSAQATTVADGTAAPAGDKTPGTSLSACEIVAPADIEDALELDAGAVADGTLKQVPTSLDPAESECRYDDEWGGLVVRLTPTNGANTYNAVEKAFGDDAEKVPGIGDGALWFEKNDRGYFLKGNVHVLLQFTHIAETITSFRDPTIALGTAAVAKV